MSFYYLVYHRNSSKNIRQFTAGIFIQDICSDWKFECLSQSLVAFFTISVIVETISTELRQKKEDCRIQNVTGLTDGQRANL